MEFKELKLNPAILRALKKEGFTNLSPVQEQAIPNIMNGSDLIALSQTGTGKTAAYILPILNEFSYEKQHLIKALILVPTRELALQIWENCKKYSRYLKTHTVCVYGGGKYEFQIRDILEGCDILIATPGRLLEFLNDGIVSLQDVRTFVLDEADQMLSLGFLPDIKKIVSFLPKKRQTLMFSATMKSELEAAAGLFMNHPKKIQIQTENQLSSPIDQSFILIPEGEDKLNILTNLLHQEDVKKSIIFVKTKQQAEALESQLLKERFKVRAIHGDKTQGQRLDALQRFRSGNIKILVATDVAARGIDVPKITHIINYDLPSDRESYIHRIGRTGRAGEHGVAISLCNKEELSIYKKFSR